MTAPSVGPGPVAARRLSRVAAIGVWAVWLVALVLTAVGLATVPSNASVDLIILMTGIAGTVATVTLVTSGAVLITRLPRNPIGWLLGIGGFLLALSLGLEPIDQYLANASSPGAVWLAWLDNLTWVPAIVVLVVFVPLLFPTGHLPSSRWRAVAAATTVALIGNAAQSAFSPFPPGNAPAGFDNPLALSGGLASLVAVCGAAASILAVVCLPLVVVSLVSRYRRAARVERQQLKWFAAVAAIIAPAFVVAIATSGATSDPVSAVSNVAWLVIVVGLALLPVAIGIAVLRYRLFEIDRLISRTLVYAGLTGALGAIYLGSILLIQALLAPFTSSNELAVAASTLVVAALFQPVRGWLKRAADRRFNRASYDGERELVAFSTRLRDEVDLAQVRDEIASTVDRILQPLAVSVWVRGPAADERAPAGGHSDRTS